MAACPRCGAENDDTARYCSACGATLSAAQARGDVRKTVTVLFCDVRGSTQLGDNQDPERLRRVLSRYFDEVRVVVERHGGTVEKFIGDAVMAVFGVPVLHEDDALRAVRAAVELRGAMAVMNDELDRWFDLRLEIRTGLNSGEVVAGYSSRGDSFVTGDAVNVAQRLESAATPGEILIGEATYRLVRDAVRAESVGLLALRGKGATVQAYRLLDIVPGAPSHARRLDSPLVGRDRECDLLRDAFDRAVEDNTCHLFTVLGPAGVGKSRLVLEFAADIHGRADVLTSNCVPYGEVAALEPVLDVVRQATGITVEDLPHEARLKLAAPFEDDEAEESSAGAVDSISDLLGFSTGASAGELGFWSVRKLLEAVARKQPLVLVLDDLHWAEATLLDFLDHVMDWAHDSSILLVCMARPELLDLSPAWGGGKHNSTTIFLEPLSEADSDHLLLNLLGAEALDEEMRARICESAEGNPLFLEEMLSMLIDDGLLWQEEGSWTTAAEIRRVPIPPSIQVLLAARLDRLGPERRVLERAAIEGKIFHRRALDALSVDESADTVERCLEQLVRKELIRPYDSTLSDGDVFRFRHVIIRDVAYEALPKQVRAELHERFAHWLEESAGSRPAESEELLGYHLEQVFRYRTEVAPLDNHGQEIAIRAGTLLASAGRRALDRGDTASAVNLLMRSAALLPDGHAKQLSLLPELGAALRESGELVRAEQVLQEALASAGNASDQQAELRARIERAALHLSSDPGGAETDTLVRQVEEAIPVLETLGQNRELAQAWSIVGSALGLWKGRFARGEQALERALVHARQASDRRQEAFIVGRLCFSAQWGPTPVSLGIARCHEIIQAAGGHPLIEAGVARYLACLEARLGRFDVGRSLGSQAREGFEDLGMRLTAEAVRAFSSADVEILAGDFAAAERELRAAEDALVAMGERAYLSSVTAFLARALYGQGRFDEATELAVRARENAVSYDFWTDVMSLGVQAKVLARRGGCRQAEALAHDALDSATGTDALELQGSALLDLAEVLVLCGATDRWRPYVEEAIGRFEQKGTTALVETARRLL